jgi:hypothetical protein
MSDKTQVHLPWEDIFNQKLIIVFSISLQLSCIHFEEKKNSQVVFSISLQLNKSALHSGLKTVTTGT